MTIERKTLGVLLKESFSFYTRNILTLTKGVISAYLPLLLVFSVYVYFLNFINIDQTADQIDPVAALQAFFLGIAFFLGSIVFSLFYQVAFIKTIMTVDQEGSLDIGGLLRESWSLLRGYLGVVLRVIVRLFLWTLLFVIPGIVFAIFYSYASLAFVVDGKQGYEALIQSKRVIKPAVWKFLGNTIAVSLIVLPFYILVSVIVEMVFGRGGSGTVSTVSLLGSILGNLMGIVIGIYPMVFFYFLYKELQK